MAETLLSEAVSTRRVGVKESNPAIVRSNDGVDYREGEDNDVTEDGSDGTASDASSVVFENGSKNRRNQWIFFVIPDSFQCTVILEALLENIQYGLAEPITLGFFPYFTHGATNGSNIDRESSSEKQDGTDNLESE